MADYSTDQLYGKLERADAAGDTEAAKVIADEIRRLESGGLTGTLPKAGAPRVPSITDVAVESGYLPEGLQLPAQYVEDALRSARQGATFGFSDELVGARDALGAAVTGGDIADTYRQSRDLERQRLGQFEQESPAASLIGNIGGGLLTGVGSGGKVVAQAPTFLGKLARSIPTGAGYGALAGLGVGEGDFGQQLDSVERGLITGAIAGPVLTAVTSAVPAGYRLGRTALSRLSDMVSPPPRVPTPSAPSATSAQPQPVSGQPAITRDRALDLVADTMRKAGVTPDDIERGLVNAEDLGLKPEILADFLGDQGARRLYSTRTLGGPASSEAVERLAQRGEGTAARVSEDVQRATSQRGQSLTQLDARIDTRRRMGNTLYQQAFQHGAVTNPDTLALVQNPRVAAILKQAEDRSALAADLRNEAYTRLFQDTENGPVLARQPTVSDLHRLKTSLDDDIRKAFKDGNGEVGKALRGFKDRIVANLEDEVPAYRKARETYKGDIEIEEAIENGRADILRKPVDELRRDFQALSQAEQDAYRSGAIDTFLARNVDRKVDSADFARSLWGNKDSRNRLQLLVKNEDELVRLARQFEREQRIARTNRAVLGGSPTAMRQEDIAETTAGTLADVATQGPTGAFVSTVGRWIRRAGGLTEAVADDVAKLLTAESPETIRAVLRSLDGRERFRVAQALRQQQAAQGAASTSAQQTNGNP